MYLRAFALVLLLGSVASAQILETTIILPDTLGPLNGPYHLACTDDLTFPRLYIGGEGDSGGVIVAEAITCKRLARIPTGPVKELCYVSSHNKLYVARLNTDSVEVVDCATSQIISTIHTAGVVPAMQYNYQVDRLYCGGSTISVIDCSADTVVHTIAASATALALDSTNHKLYAGSFGSLAAIDCNGDSIVATILLSDTVGALSFNPTAGKIYATSGETLYAVRADNDSIVARLSFAGLAAELACDPLRDRVYCAYGTDVYLTSIDCAGDTLLFRSFTGNVPDFLACDVARDRLYYVVNGSVNVIDGTTGQILTAVTTAGTIGSGWSPGLDRVYCPPLCESIPFSYQACLLTAVDCAGDSVAGIVPLTLYAGCVTLDTLHNRLYFMCPSVSVGCISAVDCSPNTVMWHRYAGGAAIAACYNPNNDRLYWGTQDAITGLSAITVYDCAAESVVKRMPVPGLVRAFRLHKTLNKLYAETEGSTGLCIIDCEHDSLVNYIHWPEGYPRTQLLVPEDNRYWYLGPCDVIVIDCLGDTVVADVPDTLGSVDDACACPEDRKIFAGWGVDPLWIIDMDNPAHVETLQTIYDVGMRFYNIPGRHKVYWCTNEEHMRATFRVIDTRTNIVGTTFGVGYHVSGMSLDHTGRYMYCACVDSFVLVVDTQADSVVATVRLHSWTSTREPLSANRRTNRIYVAQYEYGGACACGSGIPVIRDSMLIGVEESDAGTRSPVLGPTLVSRGASLHMAATSALYDAAGRKVAVLRPRSGDIRGFSPGVYFLRGTQTQAQTQAVRKLVITR